MKANISNIQKTYSKIPSVWEFEGVPFQGYEHFTELHYAHGWRDVVILEFNPKTHKLSNEFVLIDDIVTKEVIGLSEEELQAKQLQKVAEYRTKIYNLTDALKSSAKARALNKVAENLTDKQLNELADAYTQKKKVAEHYLATGEVSNEIIFDLIEFEEVNDFAGDKLIQTIYYLNSVYGLNIPTEGLSRIQMYCYIVVSKFGLGNQMKQILNDYCEVFRSKLITHLDNLEFDKIDAKIALVQTITNETTLEEIMDLKTQFDAL